MKNILKALNPIDIEFVEARLMDFFEYGSNEKLYEFMRELLPHKNTVETYDYFSQLISREGVYVYPIFMNSDKVIGTVTLTQKNKERNIWIIGYASSPSFAGLPIIPLTVAAVIWIAFRKFGVRRLEGVCQIDNLKSQDLLAGLGFHNEGTMRRFYKCVREDIYLDAVSYSLFWDEFRLRDKFDT